MLPCQELLDLIEEVSLRVLLAPTGAIRATVMAPAMEEVDIAVVDTRVPAFITDPVMVAQAMVPAMAPAMAPATTKNKHAKPSTKSIAATSRNKSVNKLTKP